MKIYVKYQVNSRCEAVVQTKLDELGLHYRMNDLGEVEIREDLTAEQYDQLRRDLLEHDIELLSPKQTLLIARIKSVVIEMVSQTDQLPREKNSNYISGKLQRDYDYLAHLFSAATGITIEHYIIRHKIDLVKKLLLRDELTLTDIADKLNYSSVAHLSSQFKKVTGLTPSCFKDFKHQICANSESTNLVKLFCNSITLPKIKRLNFAE